ncbi:MAG TPA: GNAT family protein [Gaiella sp.]|nr:GNAT family protein [Gaiella sp.]
MTPWRAPTLEGHRVRLEPMEARHAEGLWEASRDPRTWRWLSLVHPSTRADFDVWLDDALATAQAGAEIPLVTLCHKEVVGSTRFLALRPEHRSVEVGWTWLHPSAWGTGVNVEAKLLMLRHAFDVWGCRRVELKTDARNERSRGAMEAMGATFEGIHRKHMLVRDGENRDSAWYSITDDEWPAVERGLLRRLVERTAVG